MKTQSYLLVIFTLAITKTSGQALYEHRDVMFIKYIELDFTVPFDWIATRGTTNLTIEYSSNYQVTVSEQDGTLTITVVDASSTIRRPRANADCSQGDCLNLLVPGALVEVLTQLGDTWPVLCHMHHLADYSSLPSNNALVFEDKYCTVRQPIVWDEWLASYFGNNSGQSFFSDYDGDGLVNILEFYGSAAFEGSFLTIAHNGNLQYFPHRSLNDYDVCTGNFNGTDPTRADTDGDLLLDGFEVSYLMNPLVVDDPFADADNDSMDALTEQIHTTNPMSSNTDGDRVPDGEEVAAGTDPKNPADTRDAPSGSQFADVELTIGDPSGSHSERYILHVGSVSHQSPDYGEVGSGIYKYGAGSHTITIQHYGSILEIPDYDYSAYVVKVSGEATTVIDDPEGILGDHTESSFFYAAGKSANLIVQSNCTGDVNATGVCACARWTTCLECKADNECIWDIGSKICQSQSIWNSPWDAVSGTELCPCEECQVWYDIDNDNTTWLTEINDQIKCPCVVTKETYNLVPADQPPENWVPDIACMVGGIPFCSGFHPGADGCLLSVATTSAGARQQCCYGDNGVLLSPADDGAGYPARAGEFWEHQEVDVEPYEWCCAECEETGFCPLYKQLRLGNALHC